MDLVRLPEEFTFSSPSEWPVWKRRFERYTVASGIDPTKEESKLLNLLLYLMGRKGELILDSFKLSATELKSYTTVLTHFDTHFTGKKNVVYDRFQFNRRVQLEGECVDDFITDLHQLAALCDYGTLEDDLIRDRIVARVRDTHLSEKLQLEATLTLKDAVTKAKQYERVRKQQEDLHGDRSNLERMYTKPIRSGFLGTETSRSSSHSDAKIWKCFGCGSPRKHPRNACPAQHAECHNCKKKGHFARICKSHGLKANNNVQEVAEDLPDQLDAVFLGEITDLEDTKARWTAEIMLGAHAIRFKLDPGADVTVISDSLFDKYFKANFPLRAPNKQLFGPGKNPLRCPGMFVVELSCGDNKVSAHVYVVKGLERPLLGVNECERLNLVKRVDAVTSHTQVNPQQEFPELFTGIGTLEKKFKIRLKDGARPYAVSQPRRVPLPLLGKVKAKLDELLALGVITPVDDPTDWCAPMVVVIKPNGDIRICVDFTKLNESVEREFHPMPIVQETLAQLAGARYFSKGDQRYGFHQILLDEESCILTTFITPYGRFCYLRGPFGVSSLPEHFQKRISEILAGLPGICIHSDDWLCWGSTIDEHDIRLRKILKRFSEKHVTLNPDKCVFGVTEVKFLGHVINESGIHPDDDKIRAILDMEIPSDVSGVRTYIGLVTYLGHFLPHLSTILHPLYQLLKKDTEFRWGKFESEACNKIAKVLTSHPVLALYDPRNKTIVSADASSFGFGAILRQLQLDKTWRLVACASRSLSPAEKRYAQIEKESLAMVWACEKFEHYILGLHIQIETDHKPLLATMKTKALDQLSPRLQRFRLRMMRYSFDVVFTPGNKLIAADVLSRHPLPDVHETDLELDASAHINSLIENFPCSDDKLGEIVQHQLHDPAARLLTKYSREVWPGLGKLPVDLRAYYHHRADISVQGGIIMYGSRIVIPPPLRHDMLQKLHTGHLGVSKCRARAAETVWWPGISSDIRKLVEQCPVCIQHRSGRKEPLLPSEFPARPWQKVALDLFYLRGSWYLLLVDFYSRYPELVRLDNCRASTIITHLKSIFARHGFPQELRSDNGSQFDPLKTREFIQFSKGKFLHVTSSPLYPQSNGFIEAMVKTIKLALQKGDDPYESLLEYRSSPLANGYSPAELLMSRKIQGVLPVLPAKLSPQVVDTTALQKFEATRRTSQEMNFDTRHGVIEKESFQNGEVVWVKDRRQWGVIQAKADAPRSYMVKTPDGVYRRNSSALTCAHYSVPLGHSSRGKEAIQLSPSKSPSAVGQRQQTVPQESPTREALANPPKTVIKPSSVPVKTRSGRTVKIPNRLNL